MREKRMCEGSRGISQLSAPLLEGKGTLTLKSLQVAPPLVEGG